MARTLCSARCYFHGPGVNFRLKTKAALLLMVAGSKMLERVIGFEGLFYYVSSDPNSSVESSSIDPEQLEREIQAASRWVPRVDCKHQAAVAAFLLHHLNIPCEIILGLRRDADGYSGHAWVTTDSGVLFEPRAEFQVVRRWGKFSGDSSCAE